MIKVMFYVYLKTHYFLSIYIEIPILLNFTLKFFLLVQALTILLKIDKKIGWEWNEVFWIYWVFFSCLIGISFGIFLMFLSKLCQYFGKEVLFYEVIGIFWICILAADLTGGSYFLVTEIDLQDDSDEENSEISNANQPQETEIRNIMTFPKFLKKFSSTYFKATNENIVNQKLEKHQQKKQKKKKIENPTKHTKQASSVEFFIPGQEVNKLELKSENVDTYNYLISQNTDIRDLNINTVGAVQTEQNDINLETHKDDLENSFVEVHQDPQNENLSVYKKKSLENIELEPKVNMTFDENVSQDLSISRQSNPNDKTNVACLICFDKQPDSVILNCGHGGICYECSIDLWKSSPECFLCREKIEQILQIDLQNRFGQYIKVISSTQMLKKKKQNNNN